MKPIAIFRHAPTEGPGYFAEFLEQHQVPWQVIAIDAGAAVPASVSGFAGLVFMGGPMSVNDDLSWISAALDLIRDAHSKDIPLLGHCLGGQLIAKALGGVVTRNPVKEIGWGEVAVSANDVARSWFGEIGNFTAFHWHGETFSLPRGAVHLLSSADCPNQGYALGKHLGLQCHVEMTAVMVENWCAVGADEVAASRTSPAVQKVEEILRQTPLQLPQLQQVAARLYGRWLQGVPGWKERG